MTAVSLPQRVDRNRAAKPGSSRIFRLAYSAVFAVLLGLLAYGIYGYATAAHPKTILNPSGPSADHPLIGTYAKPVITVAGDVVEVKTPIFNARAVITGPQVPGEGYLYQPQAVVATWTVHIYHVKGTIPLAAADFDSIDYLGTEFGLLPPAGTTIPTSVSTGGHVRFELRGDVPIGENLFRWAPNGRNIVAKWDNQVEND